ncbi:MW1434 family type I TA system toxin [Xenorhabdus sp. PB30.3]|uniref:Thoeris anti-defense Tad2 family protein n=1 Tax=Xenorhabdus sp. PB30.3 TaxID=2788941 RepID=UPI001E3C8EDD|nr:MW1434 family type I TA system toxin [Xenorhabdus sp. PB30.3]MCC8379572.1 DUF2829 domain-containing protein [Xenorhabdus sp. PB30.3]
MSDLMAKAGSYAWALLQLQNGQRVSKKTWANQEEYLLRRLGRADQPVNAGDYPAQAGVKVGTRFHYLPYLERHTASGNVMPWLASVAEMDALDWEVVVRTPEVPKRVEYRLVLDKYTSSRSSHTDPAYDKWTVSEPHQLMLIDTTFGFGVPRFDWVDNNAAKPNEFSVHFSNQLPKDREKVSAITDKKLTITVKGIEYPLGHRTPDSAYHRPCYQGSEAEKIGELVKTMMGTVRFHFKWHD